MNLELAYYGDKVLRQKAEPVTRFDDELREFIAALEQKMLSTKGLGIAAPQVHRSLRIFIINIPVKGSDDEYHPGKSWCFVNPKILSVSEQSWTAQEGCLSIPKIYEDVTRPLSVKVEYQDPQGNVITQEFTGWEARAILHENDHINGTLFIDRIHGKRRKALEPLLNDIKRKFANPCSK